LERVAFSFELDFAFVEAHCFDMMQTFDFASPVLGVAFAVIVAAIALFASAVAARGLNFDFGNYCQTFAYVIVVLNYFWFGFAY
jgi:hypothetical protein